MKLSEFKQLIKQSILEEKEKEKNTSGAMTPEEEEMVADYEREQDAKHALDKEQPMEEGSVILNHDEVYAKYSPLVKQYMEKGLNRLAAIKAAEHDLAKEYGTTSMNIAGAIGDYFDAQYMADDEVIAEAEKIVAEWNTKKQLTEEMHGGYLEVLEMNPAFEEGVANLLQAWNEWKEGEMTEPYMIEEAKQDVLAYLSSMMK